MNKKCVGNYVESHKYIYYKDMFLIWISWPANFSISVTRLDCKICIRFGIHSICKYPNFIHPKLEIVELFQSIRINIMNTFIPLDVCGGFCIKTQKRSHNVQISKWLYLHSQKMVLSALQMQVPLLDLELEKV